MKISKVLTPSFKSVMPTRKPDTVPMWQRRLSADSMFCRACVRMGYLTTEQMQRATLRYRLGCSRLGGVIFWQIDQLGNIFDGKIMYYREDCHRDHQRHPNWVSHLLKRHYQCPVDTHTEHCLFGTHLLNLQVDNLPFDNSISYHAVAVVEAEKTAVIMSEHFPQYLWQAAGGLNELTVTKLFPLRNHQVILFPDTDETCKAYTLWYEVAQKAMRQNGGHITVSPILELHATLEQKRRKIDLVDFLFETSRFEAPNASFAASIQPVCSLQTVI